MTDDGKSAEPEDTSSTQASGSSDPASTTIGPYRLLQKLGEGGMGEVWLAEQQAPIRRRVALKLIKHGMDSKQGIARFEAERQALALMEHASIAKVLDAGTTPDGRLFFAMEYVQGESLTAYCDRHRLSVRERLELFTQVCEGVQHAHQKGIIHRDLKPSNILVTLDGERPIPKIIDFGVAKATAQRLTESTLFTELGVMIGTPEYMSPEQADLTGQDVDTRTDVYALGVLLYELLTGALPFDVKELRHAGFDEIRRRIREVDPPRPSTRISTLGDASAASARNRRTELQTLFRMLRGDLDWITMKALEKDRTRRYSSASEFAADVRRHLAGEAVLAAPPGVWYRFHKSARRHRGLVAACTAVAIALAAGMSLALTLYVRADRSRENAERNAYRATIMAAAASLASLQVFDAKQLLADADPKRHGWEWRYLKRRSESSVALLDAGELGCERMTIDGGGRTLTCRRGRYGDAVWSTDTLAQLRGGASGRREDKREAFRFHDVSNDGSWRIEGCEILSRKSQCMFALTENVTGRHVASLDAGISRSGGQGGEYFFASAVFSPDSSRVATMLGHDLRIWRTDDGRLEVREDMKNCVIHSASFAPDGSVIAIGCEDGRVLLAGLDGRVVSTLVGHAGYVISLSWFPDGDHLVSTSSDRTARVWEVGSRRAVAVLRGHTSEVLSVAVDQEGKHVATGSEDGTVRLWDPWTGTETAAFLGHVAGVFDLVFSRDGSRLFSRGGGDSFIRVWDTATSGAYVELGGPHQPYQVAFTSTGTLVGSTWEGSFGNWDAVTGEILRETQTQQDSRLSGVAVSPDDHWVACHDLNQGGTVVMFTTALDRPPMRLSLAVTSLAWSHRGLMIGGGADGRVHIFDPINIAPMWSFDTYAGWVSHLEVSADGRLLGVVSQEASRREEKPLTAVSRNDALQVWDLAARKRLCALSAAGRTASFAALAISPDGNRLAVADGATIRLVKTRSCDLIRSFGVFSDPYLNDLAFSPDGSRIAAVADDGVLRLFDAETGDLMLTIRAGAHELGSVVFSPDGAQIVTTSRHGSGGRPRIWGSRTSGEVRGP